MKRKTIDGHEILRTTQDGYHVIAIKNGFETQIKYHGNGRSVRMQHHTTWFDNYVLFPLFDLLERVLDIVD